MSTFNLEQWSMKRSSCTRRCRSLLKSEVKIFSSTALKFLKGVVQKNTFLTDIFAKRGGGQTLVHEV